MVEFIIALLHGVAFVFVFFLDKKVRCKFYKYAIKFYMYVVSSIS